MGSEREDATSGCEQHSVVAAGGDLREATLADQLRRPSTAGDRDRRLQWSQNDEKIHGDKHT